MAEFNWPVLSASVTTGATSFTKNGVTTAVTQDTTTPANSVPFPVINLNTAGNETGTASVPFRVDPTGSTTQPVSAASLPLPTGAATAAKQPALGTAGSASADVITVQGIASMTALKVDQTNVNGIAVSTGNGVAGTGVQRVTIASDNTAFAVNATLQTGANVVGKVSIDQSTPGTTNLVALAANQSVNVAQMNGVATTMGNGIAGTGVQRVAIASDNTAFSVNAVQSGTWTVQPGNTANTTAWLTTQITSSTATVTSVASSATTVSLLASNASRKNATFYNDSTQVLYLKLGTTASTSSYTVQITAGGYYELPVYKIYTGAIDGIWASANGNVRITELT